MKVCRERRWARIVLGVFTGCACMLPGMSFAQPPGANRELTPELVVDAIDRGVEYLKRMQDRRGTWPFLAGDDGATALCTLALLNAGVKTSDPAMKKALSYLSSLDEEETYTVALQTMVLAQADPGRYADILQRNVDFFTRTQARNGAFAGAWGYPGRGRDNSNSQFAVLALYEAERAGAKVDPEVWRLAHEYWLGAQNPDGSWGYKPRITGTGSMTCAGLGALIITSERVANLEDRIRGDQVLCCTGQEDTAAIDRGLAWMARNFSVRGNPGQGGPRVLWHYYYLYGLERVGRLSGQRFIGEHDWYREGTDYLVRFAKAPFEEAWKSGGNISRYPHITTSFALLFLSKGRRPVIMAKLKHTDADEWNRHPRDVQRLANYTESVWGLDLTWQTIDPAAASVEDLLETPVLVISGSKELKLNRQADKLRDFIDRGGFVFAEACCDDNQGFERDFRELISQVFPENEYRLRQLEPEHPIWRAENVVRPESPYIGRLWAVEYGCRTCVVFSDRDLSCFWELYRSGQMDRYPKAVRQQMQDALDVGINVLTYATNREPKYKEQVFRTRATDQGAVTGLAARGVLQLAKLEHGGGCNDAPAALANLARTAQEGESRLRLETPEDPVAISEESLREFHVVFMHGRHAFRLTPQERQALANFLQRGGTLFADSICSSEAFLESFRREINALLPDAALQAIPSEHPLYSRNFGGFDLRSVTRREPRRRDGQGPNEPRLLKGPPQLEGLELDGRLAVIFSPLDISCALEQHEANECRGYTRQDAARIALNILLYVMNQ